MQQWLAHLERLHPKSMDLGLERISQLAAKLQVIHFPIPVITVGGTNGKGSTITFLETILRHSGYKVGAYTSPHLLQFNERIHINGEDVSDEVLCEIFQKIENARENLPLTFFEFTTLAALLIFKQADLDIILLEVGLGGRLDATNIVESDIAVITSIDLDHMEWLGDTREAIAKEKAGILRPHKPAVCGDTRLPKNLKQIAEQQQTPLYCLGFYFNYEIFHNQTWRWYSKVSDYNDLPMPQLPITNAATALMVINLLSEKMPIDPAAIYSGIAEANMPGRFQIVTQPVKTILDVAHNPASALLLAENLQTQSCQGKTFAVTSILVDKDIAGTVSPLLPIIDTWYVGGVEVARGASGEHIAQILRAKDVTSIRVAKTVELAWQQAVAACGTQDRIVVFGSFYTVASVLKFLSGKR